MIKNKLSGIGSTRDHFAFSIFWHDRLRIAALFGGIYPWLWIGFVSAPNSTRFVNAQSPLHSSAAASLSAIVILSSSIVPALIVTGAVGRRMASAKLCGKLYDLLWRRDDPEETTYQWQFSLPADPLGSQCKELADIANDLSAVALSLDSHQPRGFAPHPIATYLDHGGHYPLSALRYDGLSST